VPARGQAAGAAALIHRCMIASVVTVFYSYQAQQCCDASLLLWLSCSLHLFSYSLATRQKRLAQYWTGKHTRQAGYAKYHSLRASRSAATRSSQRRGSCRQAQMKQEGRFN